jgi:FG-GAP repeat.
VFNGDDWVMPYLGLLADDGANGLRLIARYDGDIPGWGGLARNDKFYVGDFSGDGKDDLYVFNGLDWSMTYVAMLRSTGTGFTLVRRFDGDIPGWGGLAANDQLHVGDFDGDGRDDLYIFNGPDWSMPYLGMFRSNGSDLSASHRYDGDVPGWGGLAVHDRFIAADVNRDGKTDLIAINTQDWSEEYLGRMISTGSALRADFTGDWVGEWNLGPADLYESCNASGGTGQPTIFIHNTDWFGMIDISQSPRLQQIYFKWIHNYRHGRHW